MIALKAIRPSLGFTLIEILVAMGVFGVFAAFLLTTWSALQVAALNTTTYAKRQNDQMRVVDYVKRDVRRASNVEIYNGASLVTGNNFGPELRVTIPDYYADSRDEDNAIGTRTPNTPALASGTVSYGATMIVRYYVSNGGVIRNEAGRPRTVANSAGAFTLAFRREATGEIRSRVVFDQPMRGGGSRTLHRQIDALCVQRAQLQL